MPLIFLLVSGLMLLGSVLHEPNNYDGLNYRAPKVLYWLDANRWHWIHSSCPFINYTFPNYEWLTVPIYLVSGGFHATVVVNWLAFLLLPGLVFSVLRLLGANPRAAYDWMWLLPTGYIIALEAGGIENDLVGRTALLASIHCASRFNASPKGGYLLDALLAAGFCTGIKISNLPLGAFALIVLLKEPLQLLRHRVAALGGALLCLACSGFIPLVLNRVYTGSALGAPAGADQTTSPLAGWLGNAFTLLVTALAPPLGGSHATAWLEHFGAGGVFAWIHAHYDKFSLRLNDLPQAEGGGFGLGITVGVVLWTIWWWRRRQQKGPSVSRVKGGLWNWQRKLFLGWLVFGLVVILARLGLGTAIARALLPWLALGVAVVLGWVCAAGVKPAPAWRWVAPLLALSIVPALLATPLRPLVPGSAIVWLGKRLGLKQPALEQMQVVYDVYAHRADPFTELRQSVPPETASLAIVSDGFDMNAAYWKPYRRRRCVDWLSGPEVRAAQAQATEPLYVILKDEGCRHYFGMEIADWLKTYRAVPLKTVELRVLASQAPHHFTLARLEPGSGKSRGGLAKGEH